MPEQFFLPGFGDVLPKPAPAAQSIMPRGRRMPYNLFFSIFPDADAAGMIAQQSARWGHQHGLKGKPLLAHRLHVTLHDLGGHIELPQDLVDAARQAGDAVSVDMFDVAFDRAMSFPSSGTYVLCGGAGTAQLAVFRQSLGLAMGNVGLPVRRSFTPHMTVLYDRQPVAEHAIEPIHWTVKEFVLIKSHVGQGVHEVLERWPLRA